MSIKKKQVEMDPRCPRKLESHPEKWCPLAILRLKAIQYAGRELTEEEEANLPGCPWAIHHQQSNYCFFRYAKNYLEDESPSDIEIAKMCSINSDVVKKTEKKALQKVQDSSLISQIRENFEDQEVVEGTEIADYFSIIK